MVPAPRKRPSTSQPGGRLGAGLLGNQARQLLLMPQSPETTATEAVTSNRPGSGGTQLEGQPAPSIVHNVVASSGQRLDGSARKSMETRFGHDLGSVRIHTGREAAESTRAIAAT